MQLGERTSPLSGSSPDAAIAALADRFLERCLAGRRDDALRLVRQARRRRGAGIVIEQVLTPALRTVGERWQVGLASVADEHLVTEMCGTALATLATPVHASRGTIVIACAQGEEHAMPARLAGELLALRRWSVLSLGPSAPPGHVAGFVARLRPLALLVSCTRAGCLPAVAELVETTHEVGFPVLVGGAALGSTAERTRRLGADGWARDANTAHGLLSRWAEAPPPLGRSSLPWTSDIRRLLSRADEVAASTTARLLDVAGWQADELPADLQAQLLSDVRDSVKTLGASVLLTDIELLQDYADWLSGAWTSRGLRPSMGTRMWECLRQEFPVTEVRAVLTPLLKRQGAPD